MALQVWLPLNGNLNNQGLSNITVTNVGATVNAAGKIGNCYSFDGTDDYLTLSNITFQAGQNFHYRVGAIQQLLLIIYF